MRVFFILLIVGGFMPQAWGAVVHLKDGSSVEGTITQQNDKSIKIDMDGTGLTYYADEIQDIDGKPFAVTPPEQSVDSAAPTSTDSLIGSTDKKALILKLMEVAGARAGIVQYLNFMKKNLPPEASIVLDKIMNVDELLEKLIPVYDQNLTTEELQGLISFYESDIGHKYLSVLPVIEKESMQAGQDYVKNKLAQYKNEENSN